MKKIIAYITALIVTLSMSSEALADTFSWNSSSSSEDNLVVEEVTDDWYFDSIIGYYEKSIVIYNSDGSTSYVSGPKIASYYSPEPFYTKELSSGKVLLQWERNSNVSCFKIYKYDSKKKKYVPYKTVNKGSEEYECSYTYAENLSAETTHKFLLRGFDSDDEKIVEEKASIKTSAAAPLVTVKHTSSGISVGWTSQQKNATGCEVYVNSNPAKGGYYPTNKYFSCSADDVKKAGFSLKSKSKKTASGYISLKDETCAVVVRTYKVVNGKKKYSSFSTAYNSEYIDSYVNSLTLNPKAVTKGEELELVKKYVNSVIKDGMSNYDKLDAIFELVCSHGTYQTDITKIDGNRPVWQIMEKQEGQCASWAYCLDAMLEYAGFDIKVARGLRSSGQQHFWCIIEIDGKQYNMDAQLGTFLSPYDDNYKGYVIQDLY